MPDSRLTQLRDDCERLLAQLIESPAAGMTAPDKFEELVNRSFTEPRLHQVTLDSARRWGARCAAEYGAVQDLIGQLLQACNPGNHPNQQHLAEQTDILAVAVQAYLDGMTRHLAEQAQRDPLTKLFNRVVFDQRLREELMRARRYQRELCLMLVNLNQFKQVYQQLGQPVGDEVLQRFARLLQVSLRQSDAAFRYGGDEFAVLLPETGVVGAQRVRERLEGSLRESFHFESLAEPVHISYGIASFPQDASSALELLKLADVRLYESKRAQQPLPKFKLATEGQY